MKICIGYPPVETGKGAALISQNRQFQFFNSPTYIYPVVPAYAASLLKVNGYDVRWMDGVAEQQTTDQYLEILERENPDILAIETKTPTVKSFWKFIRRLKSEKSLQKIKVVLMGDHITALPEESFENSPVDYCITGGDFDFMLLNFCNHFSKGEKLKPGFYFRNEKGEVVNTGKFEANGDLKKLPVIDRELTKYELYAYNNGNFKYTPGTYTMIGRDCWWRKDGGCTFCSWTNTFPTFRVGTVQQMLAEVENCIRLGIREIFDDTGTFMIGKWLKEFCEELIKRGWHKKVTMGCNMRPGALTQEEYNLMGKANFRFILYGLESANFSTLERINKGQKENAMWESARMAKQAGLEPHVTCMVGYPWETKEEAENTIRLTHELFSRGWIDTLQATIVIPYPGTELFKQCEQNGWLKTRDWDHYDMRTPVMKTSVPEQEILALTQGIYKSFMSPKFIMRKIFSVRDLDDVKFLLRGGKQLVGHLLDFRKKNVVERVASL